VLRGAVLAFGVQLLFVGVGLIGIGFAGAWWLALAGGAITAGTLLERAIYKPLRSERPGVGWVKTAERFIDPDTGRAVDVFYNPTSGERQYVSQDQKKD
jgi:hypothetical protein